MDSKNRTVIVKGTWILARRSTEVKITIISLSEKVLSGITVVHPRCLAEMRGRMKMPEGDQ